MVARELLDLGEFEKAYEICAAARARLRPRRASTRRFTPAGSRCASSTTRRRRRAASPRRARSPTTPLSIARAAYWQGRAAEAMGQGDEARAASTSAPPRTPIAYYGQLAGQTSGPRRDRACARRRCVAAATRATRRRASSKLSTPRVSTTSRRRSPNSAAGRWRDEAQIAALAEVVAAHADATTNVEFGKIATERGFAARRSGVPDLRRAVLRAAAAFGRPGERLRGGAAGERIRLARRLGRRRQGPDADPACRPRNRPRAAPASPSTPRA